MACVTSCPSGVRYDRLIEATRQQVERRFERSAGRATRCATRSSSPLPYPRRLRALGAPLVAYRASGLQRARPPHAPARPAAGRGCARPRRSPRRSRCAASRAGCPRVTDARGPAAAARRDAARLRAAGVLRRRQRGDGARAGGLRLRGASRRASQGCCGALELHAGREASALDARAAADRGLEATGADRIAVNSAGCGSTIKEYGHAAGRRPGVGRPRAAAVAAKARDVSEILAELGPPRRRAARAADAARLPRRLPPGARPGRPRRAARGAERDPGRRARRAGRARRVLRQRRHLQPRRAAGRGRPRPAQGGQRPRASSPTRWPPPTPAA